MLFIDTSHAYEHTLAELRKFVPLVAPGGTVLLHDTRLEVPERVGPQPPFPVAGRWMRSARRPGAPGLSREPSTAWARLTSRMADSMPGTFYGCERIYYLERHG